MVFYGNEQNRRGCIANYNVGGVAMTNVVFENNIAYQTEGAAMYTYWGT